MLSTDTNQEQPDIKQPLEEIAPPEQQQQEEQEQEESNDDAD